MSYDTNVEPCENGRFGYGHDAGAMGGKFWGVFRWESSRLAWAVVAHYNAKATARSEAMRRDKLEAGPTPAPKETT